MTAAYCAACGFAVASPEVAVCSFCAAACPDVGWPKDQLLETNIDRLRVERRLGEGAYGTVYLAVHKHLGVQRAVKVLSGQFIDERDRERFRREAEVLAGVDHPSIVHTHDFGVLPDDRPFMVQELLEGQTLAERLREGPIPADEAIAIARELAWALAYFERLAPAGELLVVHRDLKPANIMLRERATESGSAVCLFDFGIAWIDGYSRLTAADRAIGTFNYMAPEQLGAANAERPAVDGRTDVFALGVVLFEMLSGGRHPFKLEHDDAMALMGRIYRREMSGLEALREERPELVELLEGMLAYDREKRPLPSEVERRLAVLIERPPIERPPIERPPTPAPSRRREISAIFTVAAVFAAAALLAAAAISMDRAPREDHARAASANTAPRAAPRLDVAAIDPAPRRPPSQLRARVKNADVKVGSITRASALAAIETQQKLLVSCLHETGAGSAPLTLFVTIFRDGKYEREARPRGPAAAKLDRCLSRAQFHLDFAPLERGEFAVVTYEIGE